MSFAIKTAALETRTRGARRGQHASGPKRAALRTGDVHWDIDPTILDDLLTPDGLRWPEWRESGALEIVKHGPHRTVYRLELAAGEFYLKHFRAADWKARLRNLVIPCQAEREWTAALRLAELGLPTFEALGLGRTIRYGIVHDSFLISRAIPDAVPLDHFLRVDFPAYSRERQTQMRRFLAVELGRLAARLREAGVNHPDFHAGNILIEPRRDQSRLWLIDLHAVRFANRPVALPQDGNLDALAPFFARLATRSDRLRFFVAQCRPEEPRSAVRAAELSREIVARQEARLQRRAQLGWERADRAWRRGNRHVRKLDTCDVHCRALAKLDMEWVLTFRDDPENVFAEYATRWCKRTANRRVAEVVVPAAGLPVHAFWKCVERRGGLLRRLLRFRDSDVRRAWETGHALVRRGIDTPLLFVEWREADCDRWYLLTAAIPGTVPLREFMETRFPAMPAAERRDWLAKRSRRLAGQVRQLHEAGFDHRDLKFDNLLVSTAAEDPRCWLLDVETVRRWGRLPRGRAVQNLARINVSSLCHAGIRPTDRLRFLRHYLGPRFDGEWKQWWRAVARQTLRKQRQNRDRHRPLS
jgi:tRNA A-37 threonylcarbamoyl transferase component Bud32